MHAIHRSNLLKTFLVTVVTVGFAGSYAAQAYEQEKEDIPRAQKPDLLAVDLYADWCGFCAQMEDARAEVRERHADDAVLFLTLDHSQDKDAKQSEFHASMLGLEDLWEEYGGSTGRMLLIDPESKEVIAVLTHEHDTNEISDAIAANVGG